MKKSWLCCLFIGLCSFIFTVDGEVLQTARVEIPIRVYDKDTFVNNLTMDDFVVYEDGNEVKINSCYLINKTEIRRSEGETDSRPQLRRNFILIFQATEYASRIGDAIEYFFNHVLLPEDRLVIATPEKPYRFSQKTFQTYSRNKIANRAKGVLKRDISILGASYKAILNEMKEVVRRLSFEDEDKLKTTLAQYRQLLSNLNMIRVVNEPLLMEFAQILKEMTGRNRIFLFYQQEFRAIPDRKTLDEFRMSKELMFDSTELFESEKRIESINVQRVLQAFFDAAINFHFIYIRKSEARSPQIVFKEHSVDIFNVFSKLSKEIGGLVETTSRPDVALRHAAEISEQYYLLSYVSPYKKKYGSYRNIEVKIKNKHYKIIYRKGYFVQ